MGELTPVAIFAKPPVPGRTKTRLIPALGAQGAAALHGAFVSDTLARCAEVDELAPVLSCADDGDHPALAELASGCAVERTVQPPGDLGARMAATLHDAIARAGRGLVVGTDAPTLPASLLRAAVRALERAELVLGPAADGGYYLVGARGRVPAVFEGVPWSTPRVLAVTLAHAARAGATPALLPPWYDVDTPDDLRLLTAHLALEPGAAPATAQVLAERAARPARPARTERMAPGRAF